MDQIATLTIQQQPPSQVSVSGQEVMMAPDQQHLHKRKQVKNACTNCQKACKKCDDVRPCVRCVKYGLTDTCVDSVRKERKKGVRRGPYKRKERHGDEEEEKTTATTTTTKTTTNQSSDGTSTASGQPMIAYAPIPGPNGAPDYGYPANLNQYNFGPYNPAFYGSDKVPTGPYMMYPYPPMLPGQPKETQTTFPYPPQMMMIPPYAYAQPQVPTKEGEETDDTTTQQDTYQSGTEPTSQQASPCSNNMDRVTKPQPMTPVPSTSSSSFASSSPDSNEEDDPSKFARLSQLCSAALKDGDTNVATSE